MNSTAIECKLIRAGGTSVTIESTEYHFQPYTDGAHVCDVVNEEHADRFLAIREGYRLYRGEGKPVGSAAPVVTKEYADGAKATGPAPLPDASPLAAPEILLGGDFPAHFDIYGVTYALGDIVARAHTASGLSVEYWNKLGDDERDPLIEAELDRIQAAGPVPAPTEPTTAEVAADERETLVAQYVALYGKKPHYTATVEKLRDLIAAKQ